MFVHENTKAGGSGALRCAPLAVNTLIPVRSVNGIRCQTDEVEQFLTSS